MISDFISFLNQPTKGLVLELKRQKNRFKQLFDMYLSLAPKFEVELRLGGRTVFPCTEWLSSNLGTRELRCSHCLYKSQCEHQCLEHYISTLTSFCDLCDINNTSCVRIQTNKIKYHLERNLDLDLEFEDNIYLCYFKLDGSVGSYRTSGSWSMMIPRHLRLSVIDGFTEARFKNIIRKWANVDTSLMTSREVREMALVCISLTFIILWDLFHDTVFMNNGIREGHYDNTGSFDSENNLLYFLATRDGVSPDAVEKLLNSNINPQEVILGPALVNSLEHLVSWDQTKVIINSITNLYDFGQFPTVSQEMLRRLTKQVIGEQINKSVFRSTGAGVARPLHYGPPFTRYLQYRLYIRLAALVEAVSMVHFRHTVPILFIDDNLNKLRNALMDYSTSGIRRISKSNLRSIVATEPRQKRVSLKSACRMIGLKYTTVHSNIDSFKRLSPCYIAMKKKYPDRDISREYGINTRVIIESSLDDLKKWQDAVKSERTVH